MNATKEIHALNRVLYLLEENSVRYLASQNRQFEETVERLYRDICREITQFDEPYAR